MLIRPPRLNFGDVIGIIAPASPPANPDVIDRCVTALEGLGFKVKLGASVRKRNGFLAGNDRERAADVMRLSVDKKVKAVFSLRGGYGSARILSMLDYGAIRRNPKIFLGYSDITSLHCAWLTQAGMVSFHGPTLSFHIGENTPPEFTVRSLFRALMEAKPAGSICEGYDKKAVQTVRKGRATGKLMGGNLSVLCTTIGTRYQPSFRGKILLLEDIGEAPYRVDRMLTHLLNAGLLQQVVGIAVGINKNCEDTSAKKGYRQTVDDVLSERLAPLKVPMVIGLPFGHIHHNATLPIGARATLDATGRDLVIDQAAVV